MDFITTMCVVSVKAALVVKVVLEKLGGSQVDR